MRVERGSPLSALSICPPAAVGRISRFRSAPYDLTRVQGSASYTTLMGAVDTLRRLHSTTPNSRGQQIASTLGVDKMMAIGGVFA